MPIQQSSHIFSIPVLLTWLLSHACWLVSLNHFLIQVFFSQLVNYCSNSKCRAPFTQVSFVSFTQKLFPEPFPLENGRGPWKGGCIFIDIIPNLCRRSSYSTISTLCQLNWSTKFSIENGHQKSTEQISFPKKGKCRRNQGYSMDIKPLRIWKLENVCLFFWLVWVLLA